MTCGGGLPGDPNGEQAALAVETLVRKYEGAMLRETLREALTEAYLMARRKSWGNCDERRPQRDVLVPCRG